MNAALKCGRSKLVRHSYVLSVWVLVVAVSLPTECVMCREVLHILRGLKT